MATTHRVTLAGESGSFEMAEGERILDAARRAGVTLPYECGWGSCGICKATLVEGQTRLLFEDAPARDPRDERRRRIILCQSTVTSDVVLRPASVLAVPPLGNPTISTSAVLTEATALSSDISRFRFRTEDPVAYRPGQHAILELTSGLRRCYSMSGLPGTPELEFVAKRYPAGLGSGALFALEPQAQIRIEAPYGDMWLRAVDRPAVLVAGGTGVSAILALLREVAGGQPPDHGSLTVVYGAGRQTDLVCAEEISELVSRVPGARLVAALVDAPAGWSGVRGSVTDALREQVPSIDETEVYVAGPPPMVDAVVAHLKESGTPLDRVHYDRFG